MPLSTKQMEYLALAWQCFESEPKIDYAKFASVAGLKSAASARELMRVTKKKLREEYGALEGTLKASNGADGGTKTPKKATPAGKKGGAKKRTQEEVEGDVDGEEIDTPLAKRGKSVSPVKKEVVEEDGGDDDIFS